MEKVHPWLGISRDLEGFVPGRGVKIMPKMASQTTLFRSRFTGPQILVCKLQ
jgi:hypothetical protein